MLDGPDGIGKTTQIKLLAESLSAEGHKVFHARLLGGTEIGEALRSIVLSDLPRPAETNLHIMLAAYYALAAEVTSKRTEGYTVLIDRSPLSLYAYQVCGDGVDEQTGWGYCDALFAVFVPSAVVLYQATPETLEARRSHEDYFEKLDTTYHERTVGGYTEAANRYKPAIIDANGTTEEVHARTAEFVHSIVTTA